MAKKKNKIGRPSVITPETLDKLNEAFSLGCTDTEACLLADVSTSALGRYIQKHPEYRAYKEELKHTPTIKARKTVVRAIEKGDDVSARWYLERKRSDEFGNKAELQVNATGSLSIEDRSKALTGFLSRFASESE